MKIKILGKIFGIILIFVAIWNFDWDSWNQITISFVLILSAFNLLFKDSESEFLQRASKLSLYTAFFISIILIFKVLLVGNFEF